jgi:peptidoglycan/LPS O-acetylase OafA/YrhL
MTDHPLRAEAFNPALHGLRGVGAAMVFVGHITGGLALHVFPGSARFAAVAWPIDNFGVFGVELFFVISGYVIFASVLRYDLVGFVSRRLARIYPLFAFVTLAYFAGNLWLRLEPDKTDLLTLAKNLVFVDLFFPPGGLSPNAWTISYEIWYYLLIGLIVFAVRRHSGLLLSLTAIGAAAFVIAFPISVYFLAGILLHWLRHARGVRLGARWGAWAVVGSAAPLAAIAASKHLTYGYADLADPRAWAAVPLTALFVFAATEPGAAIAPLLTNRFVRFLGTVSYSLYLMHPYTYLAIRVGMDRVGLFAQPMAVALAIFYVANVAAAVAVAFVAHRLIEDWPYQRLFGRAIYRGA